MVLNSAQAAVNHAQAVRASHAKRTEKSSESRQRDIAVAQDRIRRSMAPVRSELARLARTSDPADNAVHTALREASLALQRERRKLWKMQPRKKKRQRKN